MKLQIPSIGDKLKLKKNWSFTVWSERRNESLGRALGLFGVINPDNTSWRVPHWTGQASAPYMKTLPLGQQFLNNYIGGDVIASGECILPKGTVLTVDRLYIRKGGQDFDSLSFLIHYSHDLKFVKTDRPFVKNIRFWAKLDDCNNIEFEQVTT